MHDGKVVDSQQMKKFKRRTAYIKQTDLFFDHLTVRDQLTYTALLSLPEEYSRDQKITEVDKIIEILRLGKCAKTQIKLISGGEKKRLSIGTELLTDPGVIMLDEPTSGLDSTSANALIQMIISLAHVHGKTVIIAIHQPTSRMVRSFDKLLMLSEGSMVYFGSPADSLVYLRNVGFPCPAEYNIADYWMDLLMSNEIVTEGTTSTAHNCSEDEKKDDYVQICDTEEEKKDDYMDTEGEDEKKDQIKDIEDMGEFQFSADRGRNQVMGRQKILALRKRRSELLEGNSTKSRLIQAWHQNGLCYLQSQVGSNGVSNYTDSDSQEKKYNTSWLTQYRILTHRNQKGSRSKIFTTTNMVKSVLIGIGLGLLWFQMPYTEKTVKDRSSFFFFSITYWLFEAMFDALFAFPFEHPIIMKERSSRSYHLSAYFMAKVTSETPTRMILALMYITISYWLADLNKRVDIFLGTVGCFLVVVLAGESIGFCTSVVFLDLEKSKTFLIVYALTMMAAGGFYIKNLPPWLVWVKYLSPFKYAFDSSQQLVFDRNVPCDGSGVLAEICDLRDNPGYATPSQVLEVLGVVDSVGFNVAILIFMSVFLRYAAYLVLRMRKEKERS